MLDSKNSISFKNRGIAKDNLGDIRGACSDWQKASNLGDLEARDYVRKYC